MISTDPKHFEVEEKPPAESAVFCQSCHDVVSASRSRLAAACVVSEATQECRKPWFSGKSTAESLMTGIFSRVILLMDGSSTASTWNASINDWSIIWQASWSKQLNPDLDETVWDLRISKTRACKPHLLESPLLTSTWSVKPPDYSQIQSLCVQTLYWWVELMDFLYSRPNWA